MIGPHFLSVNNDRKYPESPTKAQHRVKVREYPEGSRGFTQVLQLAILQDVHTVRAQHGLLSATDSQTCT